MEVAGPGRSRDKVGHGQRGVEDDTKVLDRVRDGYGGVSEKKIERGRELREFLASAYEHGFGFVVVEFEFVCCHPVSDVVEAVSGASQEWEYIFRFVLVLQLCVVSVEVMVDIVRLNDVGQRRGVEGEENWTQDGPLWDSTG
jgi:hypothetical protein